MMKILATLILGLCSLFPLHGEQFMALVRKQPSENWQVEVTHIDQAVDKLTDLRNKELARATWAQNQGDRLQFNPGELIDARRYWNEAETSREIAARYQVEIDNLELRKSDILKEHNVAPASEES